MYETFSFGFVLLFICFCTSAIISWQNKRTQRFSFSSYLLLFDNFSLTLFEVYFIDYVIIIVPIFSPLSPFHLVSPFPLAVPPLSSFPWVIHISSLASPFPILFLIPPCLFCTYHLCFLNSVPSPSFSSLSPN